MRDYERWLQQEGKSRNTISRYDRIASDFQTWYEATKNRIFDPRLVSQQDILKWKFYLINDAVYQKKNGEPQKYSLSTINNCIKGIRVFFRFWHSIGTIATNPTEKVKLEHDETENGGYPRWLSMEERQSLLDYFQEQHIGWRGARNRAAVFVMLYAGLGVSETVDLEPRDLNWAKEVIRVKRNTGTGEGRSVHMPVYLQEALRTWLQERGLPQTDKLFVSQRGGPLTEDGVTALFNRLREQTGISDLTPLVLRHTFARNLIMNGIPLQAVAEILGHSNHYYARAYQKGG